AGREEVESCQELPEREAAPSVVQVTLSVESWKATWESSGALPPRVQVMALNPLLTVSDWLAPVVAPRRANRNRDSPSTCAKVPPRKSLPSGSSARALTVPSVFALKVESSEPSAFSRARLTAAAEPIWLKEPATSIWPLACSITALTAPFTFGLKLASREPSAFSRARLLRPPPAALLKEPPTTTWPLAWTAMVLTAPLIAGEN